MPKIPAYQGKERFSGQAGVHRSLPGEKRAPLDISRLKRAKINAWQQVADLGETVTKIGVKMNEAQDAKDLADARLKIMEAYANRETYYKTPEWRSKSKAKDYEPDYDIWSDAWNEKFLDGLDVSNEVKETISLELAEREIKSRINVRAMSRSRLVNDVEADILVKATTLKNVATTAALAGNTEWYLEAVNQWKSFVDGSTVAGVLDADTLKRYDMAFKSDLQKEILTKSIESDPKKMRELLEKNKLEGLTKGENEIFLMMAKKEEQQQVARALMNWNRLDSVEQKLLKRKREVNETAMWTGILDKKILKAEQVVDLLKRRKISDQAAKSAVKYLTSPESVKDDPEAIFFLEDFINNNLIGGASTVMPDGTVETITFIQALDHYVNAGKIKPTTYKSYLRLYKKKQEDIGEEYINAFRPGADALYGEKSKWARSKWLYRKIRMENKNVPPEKAARMALSQAGLIKRITKSDVPIYFNDFMNGKKHSEATPVDIDNIRNAIILDPDLSIDYKKQQMALLEIYLKKLEQQKSFQLQKQETKERE